MYKQYARWTHHENAFMRLQKQLQGKFLYAKNCRTSRHKEGMSSISKAY